MAACGVSLSCSGLLDDLGQQRRDSQQLQRVLRLAAAAVARHVGPSEQHLATRAASMLGRVLEAAGDETSAHALATDTLAAGQRAVTAAAAEQATWVLASRAAWLRSGVQHVKQAPRVTAPAAAPSAYLKGVQTILAALAASRPGGTAEPVAARSIEGRGLAEVPKAVIQQPAVKPACATAVLRRALRDSREVATELSASPSDPSTACLRLVPLAASRTQAAIAAKLAGRRPARLQARLCLQLEAAERQRVLHVGLLSSQRAALLAVRSGGLDRINPHTALQRLLRAGMQQRRRQQATPAGQQQQEEVQPAGQQQAGQKGHEHPSVVLRRRLAQGVLAQHKEQRKAWREKKKREQQERMEALRGNDVEEYMRLVAGARSDRLDTLLSQTDACLRQLALRLRGAGAGDALLATAAAGSPQSQPGSAASHGSPAAAGAGASGASGSGGGGIAALEQSHEAWNQLAQAFQADVAQQPKLLTGGELREYQMKGLRWMVGLHTRGLNGILADEMGLGKTIQVIALICHLASELQERRPFLIAVPSSVLPNWESEFTRWAPDLKVICYRGDPEAREQVWVRQMRGGRGGGAGPGTHVVLTTYDYLMNKNDRPRLSRVHWSYICLDEGHRLKNAACKLNAELRSYTADHRLLLTGTPLQNNISELWSLLNFLMPTLFDSGEDFEQWFGGAGKRGSGGAAGAGGGAGGDSDEEEEAAAAKAEAAMLTEEEALIVTNRLHQVLRPFMLRRLKETVATELPQKREHLLPVLPSPYQQALFGLMQAELQRSASASGGGGKGSLKGVNNVIMEMRNICNHPLISRLHPEGCEAALPAHTLPAEVRLCSKLELLDRLLVKLKLGGHKVLLFCTMTRALDVISDHLDWRGFQHLRMDGSTAAADRGELVQRFNDPAGGEFVFLLSIRAGGVGLNLQGADTVIMYDTDWNPQMDLQAQARAHRMGQTREVLVLRLKTVGTIEERVVGVASNKAQLADRSITGGFFDGKTTAEERQRYLLDTIRTSTSAQQPGGAGSEGGQLSNAQLNKLLARGEGELELFQEEDRRMQQAELASWEAMQGGSTGTAASARGKQQQQQAQGPAGGYSRLAGDAEVAPLVALAAELLQPKKDEDEGREMGRGKRQRGTAAYRDLPEREFNRLCRDGVEGQDPVGLAAATAAAEETAGGAGKRRRGAAGEAGQSAPTEAPAEAPSPAPRRTRRVVAPAALLTAEEPSGDNPAAATAPPGSPGPPAAGEAGNEQEGSPAAGKAAPAAARPAADEAGTKQEGSPAPAPAPAEAQAVAAAAQQAAAPAAAAPARRKHRRAAPVPQPEAAAAKEAEEQAPEITKLDATALAAEDVPAGAQAAAAAEQEVAAPGGGRHGRAPAVADPEPAASAKQVPAEAQAPEVAKPAVVVAGSGRSAGKVAPGVEPGTAEPAAQAGAMAAEELLCAEVSVPAKDGKTLTSKAAGGGSGATAEPAAEAVPADPQQAEEPAVEAAVAQAEQQQPAGVQKKRRRGRPAAQAAADATVILAEQEEAEEAAVASIAAAAAAEEPAGEAPPPAKRQRGRPPMADAVAGSAAAEPEAPPPAPKRRGRPPKAAVFPKAEGPPAEAAAALVAAATVGPAAAAAKEPAPVPKRRGRPPKAAASPMAQTLLAASAEAGTAGGTASEVAPAPKRRGRPPGSTKAAAAAAAATAAAATEEAARALRRRRGRSSTSPTAAEGAPEEAATAGRGTDAVDTSAAFEGDETDPRQAMPGHRRKPRKWSEEEVNELMRLVRLYGRGSWATIEMEGKAVFGGHRSQVDLKDKWRNLAKGPGVAPADLQAIEAREMELRGELTVDKKRRTGRPPKFAATPPPKRRRQGGSMEQEEEEEEEVEDPDADAEEEQQEQEQHEEVEEQQLQEEEEEAGQQKHEEEEQRRGRCSTSPTAAEGALEEAATAGTGTDAVDTSAAAPTLAAAAAGEAPLAPKPRGRGRPRKEATSAPAEAAPTEAAEAAPTAAPGSAFEEAAPAGKRGRGRPRKVTPPSAAQAAPAQPAEAAAVAAAGKASPAAKRRRTRGVDEKENDGGKGGKAAAAEMGKAPSAAPGRQQLLGRHA